MPQVPSNSRAISFEISNAGQFQGNVIPDHVCACLDRELVLTLKGHLFSAQSAFPFIMRLPNTVYVGGSDDDQPWEPSESRAIYLTIPAALCGLSQDAKISVYDNVVRSCFLDTINDLKTHGVMCQWNVVLEPGSFKIKAYPIVRTDIDGHLEGEELRPLLRVCDIPSELTLCEFQESLQPYVPHNVPKELLHAFGITTNRLGFSSTVEKHRKALAERLLSGIPHNIRSIPPPADAALIDPS